MVITREDLIKRVAQSQKIPASTIRKVLNAVEDNVVECLSSTTSAEEIVIKLFSGLHIVARHEVPQMKGCLRDIEATSKIRLRGEIKRSLTDRVNR